MRRPAAGLLAALLVLATFGVSAPAAAAVPANPKIVLVVGATHGTTATYRAWMNEVYAVARKYSSNVIRVYSPNATWSAIKAAARGANILVYMGHGNGFPSPYRSTAYPQSQDGFGANATAGAGDSNTKYYGEYYVGREIKLAPNAVVILSHLCYASGNSEPGKAAPTLTQARQRIDNYGAGFIAAGARAVIADGHMDPGWYVDQLFTTHKSVDQIFRDHPAAGGAVHSFASVRSPGYTALYDPDHDSPPSGFYRSMVAIPGLRSDDVTGAGAAPSDGNPAGFVIPGAAEATNAGGAPLWPDSDLLGDPETGLPTATLPAGTRLRVSAEAATADGQRVLEVHTFDGAAQGWVLAADLAPRDSAPPRILRFAITPKVLSPIISGSRASVSAAATEPVSWKMTVTDPAGAVVASVNATGPEILTSWDGRSGGDVVPDGTYHVALTAADAWGNNPASAASTARVDATAPELSSVHAAGGAPAAPATFSPNADGQADSLSIAYTISEAASLRMVVRDGAGVAVRDAAFAVKAGPGTLTWDGRTGAGKVVADGDYAVELTPTDAAGNRGPAGSAPTRVYTALKAVAIGLPVFLPADRDTYGLTVTLPFALSRPATVSWQVVDATGRAVLTIKDGEALAAGSYTFRWDGRNADGAYEPRGTYRSVVSATDGSVVARISSSVTLDAFRVTASDATPARHQRVTFTVISAEPLASRPTLRLSEPGRHAVTYTMTHVRAGIYRVTVTLAGARTGSLGVRISARDAGGGTNISKATYPIH